MGLRSAADLSYRWAMKIISLLPGATELLCAMGLQDNLVAVSHECDYPATVAALPRVTGSVIESGLSESQIDVAVSESLRNGEPLYSVNSEMMQTLQPDLIVISAGFDAHADDPLAQLMVDEAGFADLTARIVALARAHSSGRVVSVLEGGYDLPALSRSVTAHATALFEGV